MGIWISLFFLYCRKGRKRTYPHGQGEDIFPGRLPDDVWAETVGQFTGLRDKNGKEIYEGDIVKTKEYGIEIPNGKVSFNSVGYDNFIINYIDGGFCLSNNHRCFLLCRGNHLEVNGNIYDNPN